jgi:hypothetical protein
MFPELWNDRNMNTPFVYFMLAHDVSLTVINPYNAQFIKIGVALNVRKREEAIRTASPFLVNTWVCSRGGYILEEKIHEFLKDHRVNGEWFRPSRLVLDVMRDAPEDMPEITW